MRLRNVRLMLAAVTVAGLAACGSGPAGNAPSETTTDAGKPSLSSPASMASPGAGNAELSIIIKPSPAAKIQSYTLVCKDGVPAAESSHPNAAAACAALKKNSALLERKPRPADQACTLQYGGPQTATVTGIVDGKAVEASYKLSDGCEINAWNAVRDILGSANGAV